MIETETCDLCGHVVKKHGLAMHKRHKHLAEMGLVSPQMAEVREEAVPSDAAEPPAMIQTITGASGAAAVSPPPAPPIQGEPAKLPNMRRASRYGVGMRELKMLRPICSICQSGKQIPWNWYENCPHDKYVTAVPKDEVRAVYDDEVLDEVRTGRKIVKGTETVRHWEPRPNWVQVAVTPRVNSGRGYHRARRKGFIMPTELRHEAFPFGIAPVCQFRECFNQENLKTYAVGVFCEEIEARLVWVDQEGKVIEASGMMSPESRAKRREQLGKADIHGTWQEESA